MLHLAGNGFVTGTILECTGGANLATGGITLRGQSAG